jgi:hypothetical protein
VHSDTVAAVSQCLCYAMQLTRARNCVRVLLLAVQNTKTAKSVDSQNTKEIKSKLNVGAWTKRRYTLCMYIPKDCTCLCACYIVLHGVYSQSLRGARTSFARCAFYYLIISH